MTTPTDDITPARLRELADRNEARANRHEEMTWQDHNPVAHLNTVSDMLDTAAALRAAAAKIEFASDWMHEVRKACREATGGNATFIDADVTQTIRHLSATLAAREALLERAMEGLTGMDFYSDRRALAAEIAAALGGGDAPP